MSDITNPLTDPNTFPIAVWLQDPALAPQYKELGINLYLGLWQGPTDEQLDTLTGCGMPVICHQNENSLHQRRNPIVVGWMHGDEPDNVQANTNAPVPLNEIEAGYTRMKKNDRTRPVLLNFGQGVANDEFPGRGIKPEEYPEYAKYADMVSYDVYPVANIKTKDGLKPGGDLLWYQAKGLDRLREWTNNEKPVWNCFECTHIGNPAAKVTAEQLRAQVWMSLIHGSSGLIWFVHEFKPEQNPASLLDDPEMMWAVSQINSEVSSYAEFLKCPDMEDRVTLTSSDPDVPVDVMVKGRKGKLCIFAACMRNAPTDITFNIKGMGGNTRLESAGQNKILSCDEDDRYTDTLGPYDVRIYTHSR